MRSTLLPVIDLSPLEHSACDIRKESLALHVMGAMCNGDKRDAEVMRRMVRQDSSYCTAVMHGQLAFIGL